MGASGSDKQILGASSGARAALNIETRYSKQKGPEPTDIFRAARHNQNSEFYLHLGHNEMTT